MSEISPPKLQILHLEDDPDDALFVRRLLERAGIVCEVEVVQTPERFGAALDRGNVSLILSDHSLPGFDSMAALDIASRKSPDTPFLIVSGTMGEERAVRALRNGATDYILKESPARLVSAVRRAMKEVEARNERLRLERQIIEAQKMDVIGRLVGGVAHDFNNILSVLLGYSESVIAALPTGDPLRADVEEVRHATERGAALVRQLLNFSSKQVAKPVVLDLNKTTQAFYNMLARLVGDNIKMSLDLRGTRCNIRGESGHIGQVLMNMVVNARDALPEGGHILIRTSDEEFPDGYIGKRQVVPPGEYAVLTIQDDGVGMTPEIMEHIFESFFTTKASGLGTGLGLATCRTIMQQCGGYVEVDSVPGRGTTFDLYFPRTDRSVSPNPVLSPMQPEPRGDETILLVEDDPALNRLATRTLRRLGYNVLSASDGVDGLSLMKERPETTLALVVTDVVMPQMGGQAMAEQLRQTYPDLKVLFTSGYTGSALTRNGALPLGALVLAKPYTPSLLAHKVRKVIDG